MGCLCSSDVYGNDRSTLFSEHSINVFGTNEVPPAFLWLFCDWHIHIRDFLIKFKNPKTFPELLNVNPIKWIQTQTSIDCLCHHVSCQLAHLFLKYSFKTRIAFSMMGSGNWKNWIKLTIRGKNSNYQSIEIWFINDKTYKWPLY